MNIIISIIIIGIGCLKIIGNFISSCSINNYQYIKVYNLNEFIEKLMIYSDKIKNINIDYNGKILQGSECHYYCKYLLNKDIILNDNGTYDLNKAIDYNGKDIIKELDQSYDFPIIIIVPNDNKKHFHFNWKSFMIKIFSLDFNLKN